MQILKTNNMAAGGGPAPALAEAYPAGNEINFLNKYALRNKTNVPQNCFQNLTIKAK